MPYFAYLEPPKAPTTQDTPVRYCPPDSIYAHACTPKRCTHVEPLPVYHTKKVVV